MLPNYTDSIETVFSAVNIQRIILKINFEPKVNWQSAPFSDLRTEVSQRLYIQNPYVCYRRQWTDGP